MITKLPQNPHTLPRIAAFTCVLATGVLSLNSQFASRVLAAPQGSTPKAAVKKAPKAAAKAAPKKAPASPLPAGWAPANAAQRAAASGSIVAQLNAFKAGQWDKAITYQSAGLRQQFPTPQAFQKMMESSYPQFVHFKKVEFGPAYANADVVQIAVKLTGGDNIIVRAIYIMAKEKGTYRIEGVQGGFGPDMSNNKMV